MYRTPTIDQFIDGFEYEEFSNYNNIPKWTVKVWGQTTKWCTESMIFRINRGDFRFKSK